MGNSKTIDNLTFIGNRDQGDRAKGRRHFWRVKPTGNYNIDCRMGRKLALEYLAWSEIGDAPPLLAQIVSDMPGCRTGMEVGFLELVGLAASAGASRARRIAAYWDDSETEAA
ncbi:hypothetical protein [Pararhizobium mangrovi]|uniref:Uncharacterized protein n=1 Tax=Pararhizobium mangrovi TaxID=2590452 RepID=A0A506TVF1_9HYPH|nr:hypothetical protein [Pararhizobium mangrovi]TPW26043.1 hypothetical protein FJU11_16650 [Pararhizobium mangrovi]